VIRDLNSNNDIQSLWNKYVEEDEKKKYKQ
jgi:hypothetical protein